jgi:hypothetical protein
MQTFPEHGSETKMAELCSRGASTADRSYATTAISPKVVTGLVGPYLWLYLPPGSARFYGVTLFYTA